MFTCCAATFTCAAAPAAPLADDQAAFAGAHVCKPRVIALPAELRAAPAAQFELAADEIESRDDTLRFRGNARAVQGARGLFAREIIYHRAARRAEAAGGAALYTARGDVLRAERVEMNMDDFSGEARDVRIAIAAADGETGNDDGNDDGAAPRRVALFARARASRVAFAGEAMQRLENARLSGCVHDARPVGQQDVVLSAKQITLDHARGFGTAKSMTLKFKRVPIFYFPVVTFPINRQRKTGFLFPAAGYADDSGMLIETPFYLNLAPQYDARLTPRLLSRRGAQLAGQFRYLSAHGSGMLRGEGMSSDRQFAGRDRHALAYRHRHARARWRAAADLQLVSDRAYLRDFSGDIDALASGYTARTAKFAYRAKHVRLDARAAVYDAANDAVAAIAAGKRPHAVLPRLRFALRPPRLGPLAGEVAVEYANFKHDAGRRQGARWLVIPRLRMPLRKSYGYIVPGASWHTIRYALDDSADAGARAPSATMPVYALDAGLFLRRDGAAYAQILEPRLRYLRAPPVHAQEQFPVFDTGRGSLSSIAHYFRENRFIGGDRIGDTEQVALGLGGRILRAADGAQLLHFQLGKVFYFKDRMLALDANDDRPGTASSSGLLAEATAGAGGLDVNAFARTAAGGGISAARLSAHYRRDARRRATLAYFYDDGGGKNDLDAAARRAEQINFGFDAPLGAFHQLRAEIAYSLESNATQSSSLAFRFDGCCWAARAGLQRYLDGAGERKNRFLFTLELNGLGRAASRP
ncbi:MAG: LPS assembly protein LptD [Gammaproteobacteria bacterium]